MNGITRQGAKRFGVFHWAAIVFTLLLLASSSMASSAMPLPDDADGVNGPAAQATKRGTVSPQDKTATARANASAGRYRNQVFIPTAVAMAQDAEVIFGPESGELESVEDGRLESFCAEVDLTNFIVTFRMYNPSGNAVWVYGLSFRTDEEGNAYRLAVASTNRWLLAYLDAAASSFNDAGTGSIPNMDVKKNGFNDFIIMVQDEMSLISVNGEYLTPSLVDRQLNSGDVCLIIDNFLDYERDGRTYEFENFTVYEIP
ncbi:MAG: hypothetical protein U0528_14135 [Anaerolineae bacterium]|nr:hypothetical protein [Anaerolineae bacterium]